MTVSEVVGTIVAGVPGATLEGLEWRGTGAVAVVGLDGIRFRIQIDEQPEGEEPMARFARERRDRRDRRQS